MKAVLCQCQKRIYSLLALRNLSLYEFLPCLGKIILTSFFSLATDKKKKQNGAPSSLWVEGSFPFLFERYLRNIISLFPHYGCYLCTPLLPHAQFPSPNVRAGQTIKDLKESSKEQNSEKVQTAFWKQTQACTPNQLTMSQFQPESWAVNVRVMLNPSTAWPHLSRAYRLRLTAKVFHFWGGRPHLSSLRQDSSLTTALKSGEDKPLIYPWF